MYQTHIFLQAAQSQSPQAGWINIAMMVAVVAVVYLFMIRPQTKRQKEERKFREALKKGDKVVTIGGMHGRIVNIDDASVLLEVDEGIKLRFERAAIRSYVDGESTVAK
jgi:preprotein translocase subunit YajC